MKVSRRSLKALSKITITLISGVMVILSASTSHAASTAHFLIDFGGTTTTASGWNNISDTQAKSTSTKIILKDTSNTTTPSYLKITDSFNCTPSGNGTNYDGTKSSTLYPSSTSSDSIFVGVAGSGSACTQTDTSASFSISGLKTYANYEVRFYASRMGGTVNRTTNYTIGSQTASLNATGNVNGYASLTAPSSTTGSFTATISKASASQLYGYLGVVEVIELPSTVSVCKDKKIAIVGSSSAYGTGASPSSNAWVNLYRTYLQGIDSSNQVTNLAVYGYTTYHALPASASRPSGRPASDTAHNITAAINTQPDGIIVNLPSNDIAFGYSVSEIESNFKTIKAAADAAHIPIWITTTQPRNFSDDNRAKQKELKNWIEQTYGSKSIDFWTLVANSDGTINPLYAYGDSVHLNNAGHKKLFDQTKASSVFSTVCNM